LHEIGTQPEVWRQAVRLADEASEQLPAPGTRVQAVGCGTSYFVAQAFAALREGAGRGETDAHRPSEAPRQRRYDAVIAISRSGWTTEVVRFLEALAPTVPTLSICADASTPVARATQQTLCLDFADERSVVQTRFATAALSLLRAHVDPDAGEASADAERALAAELPPVTEFDRFVFLGTGWSVGLAHEAALKLREAAGAWTESYPAMEFRHGPIASAGPTTLVWTLGLDDPALLEDAAATGATVIAGTLDPLAELVRVQRAAVALAEARGLDPDHPNHLSRAVVLP
jgi:fructoselysine-6-P-deglycase FrlB-like protein